MNGFLIYGLPLLVTLTAFFIYMQRGTVLAWVLVKREFVSTLRGGRAFVLVLLFTTLSALWVITMWPSNMEGMGNSLEMAGYLSRDLMRTFSMGLLVGSMIFVPAYAAGGIVGERERSTWDLLSTSLLRPRSILIGKLANALGFFLFLLVALAPIFCVSFFLVGIDVVEYVRAITLVLATALACASLGLYCSVRFRRSFAAIVGAFVGMLMLYAGPLVAGLIFFSFIDRFFYRVRAFSGPLEDLAEIICPPIAMLMTLEGMGGQTSLFWGYVPFTTFTLAILYELAVAGVCLALAYRRLRRPMEPPNVDQKSPIDDEAELLRRRKSFPFYLIDPLKRKATIEDGRNPMLVRELRWGLFNRGTVLVRVFYCAFILYFFIAVGGGFIGNIREFAFTFVMIQTVVTVLVAPALIANSLTKEYELRNVDMLRMTLLKPGEIIFGKWFAGALSLGPILFAAVLTTTPLLYINFQEWEVLAAGYGTLILSALTCLSLGLFASLLTRRTATALAITYTLGFFVFIGFAFVWEWWFRDPDMWPFTPMFLSPIIVFIESNNQFHFGPFQTGDIDWLYWFLGTGLWSVINLIILGVTISGYQRFRMRDR